MNAAPQYSAATIKKFASTALRTRLAHDFVPYFERRDLVRQHSNFVQLLALSGGRYGHALKVLPTFYVVGARPWDVVIPQSVGLHAEDPNRWTFQDRPLDESLADDICRLLRKESPLSFFDSIVPGDIVAALKDSSARSTLEDASLYLSFFMMANKIAGGETWLAKARKRFLKMNPSISHDWQRSTMQRFEELERRFEATDAAILCREEAEAHAARLNLPRIEWLAT